jgi:hypothetical protein
MIERAWLAEFERWPPAILITAEDGMREGRRTEEGGASNMPGVRKVSYRRSIPLGTTRQAQRMRHSPTETSGNHGNFFKANIPPGHATFRLLMMASNPAFAKQIRGQPATRVVSFARFTLLSHRAHSTSNYIQVRVPCCGAFGFLGVAGNAVKKALPDTCEVVSSHAPFRRRA